MCATQQPCAAYAGDGFSSSEVQFRQQICATAVTILILCTIYRNWSMGLVQIADLFNFSRDILGTIIWYHGETGLRFDLRERS